VCLCAAVYGVIKNNNKLIQRIFNITCTGTTTTRRTAAAVDISAPSPDVVDSAVDAVDTNVDDVILVSRNTPTKHDP